MDLQLIKNTLGSLALKRVFQGYFSKQQLDW